MHTYVETNSNDIPTGVTIKLYEVDLDGENIRNPISMRSYLNMTISEFKNEVSLVSLVHLSKQSMHYYYILLMPAKSGQLILITCH